MNDHRERGRQLVELKRPDLAANEFRLALADDPNDATTHALLASCLLDLGITGEAENEAKSAVALAPEYPFAFFTLSRTYAAQGRFEKAFSAIDEALRLDPRSADFHFFRGALFHDMGQFETCLKETAAGLRTDPLHVSCRNLRVSALIGLRRLDDADAEIDQVLRLNPEFAWSHENEGRIALRNNDAGAALRHYREALRLHPNCDSFRRGLVAALKLRNRCCRALLWLFAGHEDDRRYGFLFRGFIVSFAISAFFGVVFAFAVDDKHLTFASKWAGATAGGILPLFIAYLVGLVFYHWFASAVFVLLLRFDRLGRHALDADDVRSSNLMLSGGALSAGCTVVAVATLKPWAAFGAGLAVVFTLCVSIIYSQPPGSSRQTRTVLCLSVPMVLLLIVLISSVNETFAKEYASWSILLLLVAAWTYAWLRRRALQR